ncbi:hypothetical protein B0H13DRAFT_968512 [Mycena leptocephala]|nr:hypothetical protein B0H13DRAFT_968512 [Mycena leptocephala]
MAETTLQARLGIYPGANTPPKKTWKTKPYSGDHQDAAWPRREDSSSSYDAEDVYQPSSHVTPSLFERLGPKVSPSAAPRSLLERMKLDTTEATETDVAHVADANFFTSDAVHSANMNRDVDGEIPVDESFSARYDVPEEEDEELDIRPTKIPVCYAFLHVGFRFNELQTQTRPSWNPASGTYPARTHSSPPVNGDSHDALGPRAGDSGRVSGLMSEAPVVNKFDLTPTKIPSRPPGELLNLLQSTAPLTCQCHLSIRIPVWLRTRRAVEIDLRFHSKPASVALSGLLCFKTQNYVYRALQSIRIKCRAGSTPS